MTPRLTPYAEQHLARSVTFKAWRNDRPVIDADLTDCTCIQDAANLLAPMSPKGCVLTILETDAGKNRSVLAFYKVRESTKRYTWRASTNGGRPVKIGLLEPLLMHALDVVAFVPVEAFDAFKDDPVGHDPTLVEAKQEEWR